MKQSLKEIIRGIGDEVGDAEILSFCWHLLYWISGNESQFECDEYREYVAFDRYLALSGVKKISEQLLTVSDPSKRLLAYLHKCCVPRVLKRSEALQTTAELENERLAILQFLLLHAPDLRPSVTVEIASLTKAAKLRDAAQQVQASKIYVNKDGIKSVLSDEHKKKFERYRRLQSINNDALLNQPDLRKYNIDRPGTVVFTNAAYALVCELFEDINHLFVSSTEHGLQTYLSMRIRHGHLSAHLRGQFENYHLVTRRIGTGSEYASNGNWRSEFEELGEKYVESSDARLKRFSSDVDTLAEEVNREWIRIRDSEHPAGMFDFNFDDDALVRLFLDVANTTSYIDFVDQCLQALWQRLSDVLETVRSRIVGELGARFTVLLGDLENDLYGINARIRQTELHNSVATCRTEIPRQMTRFSDWFTTAGGNRIKEFDFELLVDLANTTVRRIHPTSDFVPQVRNYVTRDVEGMHFSAFFDMFFNLWDNVVQHAHDTVLRPSVTFREESKWLYIEVSNYVGGAVESEEIESVIRRINDLDAGEIGQQELQTEGNTGFSKIRKSLKQDLRQPAGRVTCSFESSKRMFTVVVAMPTLGVLR